jgi:hypothetical protein
MRWSNFEVRAIERKEVHAKAQRRKARTLKALSDAVSWILTLRLIFAPLRLCVNISCSLASLKLKDHCILFTLNIRSSNSLIIEHKLT